MFQRPYVGWIWHKIQVLERPIEANLCAWKLGQHTKEMCSCCLCWHDRAPPPKKTMCQLFTRRAHMNWTEQDLCFADPVSRFMVEISVAWNVWLHFRGALISLLSHTCAHGWTGHRANSMDSILQAWECLRKFGTRRSECGRCVGTAAPWRLTPPSLSGATSAPEWRSSAWPTCTMTRKTTRARTSSTPSSSRKFFFKCLHAVSPWWTWLFIKHLLICKGPVTYENRIHISKQMTKTGWWCSFHRNKLFSWIRYLWTAYLWKNYRSIQTTNLLLLLTRATTRT